MMKLSNTRRVLKQWNKESFGFCQDKLIILNNLLQEVQSRTTSQTNLELEAAIHLDIEEIWDRQESIWKQKSREQWLANRDRNTRFFHASTAIRRKWNFIWAIIENSNRQIQGRRNIGNYFLHNFKEVYKSSYPNPNPELESLFDFKISAESNVMLCKIPTQEEIKKVVWDMPPLKAPGPDGFPCKFYKQYWDVVGRDLILFVQDFFITGKFTRSINRTFLVLIPKRSEAKVFDDYRPISLCNVAYKIVSKILANQIRRVLEELISPFQSAFVPGRWIAENSVLAEEVMHSIKRKKGRKGILGLKLDMSKAYDRVERVLKANGFCNQFVKLVMFCVTSVSFSILLNGGPLPTFYPERGLRQGDPLSPYLFILCSEVLSKLILKEERMRTINGIRIAPNCPAISHLMYADDTFLFCEASTDQVQGLQRCLEKYFSWSGQRLNLHKFSVIFSKNTRTQVQYSLVSMLGCRVMNGKETFLGNPLFLTNNRSRDFKFLKDKICSKLEGWKCKLLSRAERTTLIKSVV